MTVRAREELSSPLFVPDEIAQVREALSRARAELDSVEIDRITSAARVLTFADAVADLLRPAAPIADAVWKAP